MDIDQKNASFELRVELDISEPIYMGFTSH
jgi:hypothetical protein